MKAIDDSMLYVHRHASLSEWSPFELTMGFVCGQDSTADSRLFPIDGDLGRNSGYTHKPRLDRAKVPVIVIPQPLKEHPKRPSPDAPVDMKEEYAAWAIGNFYSDRLVSKLYPDVSDRASDIYDGEDLRDETTLWSLFKRWERRRPRGDKDTFAFRCLHNIELRLEARSRMREDSNKMRVLRRQLVDDPTSNSEHACEDEDVYVSSDSIHRLIFTCPFCQSRDHTVRNLLEIYIYVTQVLNPSFRLNVISRARVMHSNWQKTLDSMMTRWIG